MVKLGSSQFTNQHSVRFNLHSFALPVTVNKKKNTIYTHYLAGLKGTTQKLLPPDAPAPTYGYQHAARWSHYVFTADEHGLYYADLDVLQFKTISQTVAPQQLGVANDRLFLVSLDRKRLIYSVKLNTEWTTDKFLTAAIFLPENYGLCVSIRPYRQNLLVICENGLLLVNKNLTLVHLAEDSENLKANLAAVGSQWQSDWFSLGYATDTQNLREVLLSTDVPLRLVVESNRTKRTIMVPAATGVQKIKIHLNGDQFKISLQILGTPTNFCVSDLAAVIVYGKK